MPYLPIGRARPKRGVRWRFAVSPQARASWRRAQRAHTSAGHATPRRGRLSGRRVTTASVGLTAARQSPRHISCGRSTRIASAWVLFLYSRGGGGEGTNVFFPFRTYSPPPPSALTAWMPRWPNWRLGGAALTDAWPRHTQPHRHDPTAVGGGGRHLAGGTATGWTRHT